MNKRPKVSIVSISYNQDKYIRKALQGFVDQKVDFEIEIIISDDASTDDTQSIIKEYAEKYPNLFKPILRDKNVGVQTNLVEALQMASGEYVALCEGDDFWVDPEKLSTQVDYMDKHTDYSVCFHKVSVIYEDGSREDGVYPDVLEQRWYTGLQLCKLNYIQTNSVLYRRQDYSGLPTDVMPLDWFLHLYHASFGKIKLIDRVMSVYRKHSEGVWWDYDRDRIALWNKYGINYIQMWFRILPFYKSKKSYTAIINNHLTTAVKDYILAVSDKSSAVQEIVAVNSGVVEDIIINHEILKQRLSDLEDEKDRLQGAIKSLQNELSISEEDRLRIESTLKQIRLSRLWKIRNLIAVKIGKSRL